MFKKKKKKLDQNLIKKKINPINSWVNIYLVISAGMLHGLVFMDPKNRLFIYLFLFKSGGEWKHFYKKRSV